MIPEMLTSLNIWEVLIREWSQGAYQEDDPINSVTVIRGRILDVIWKNDGGGSNILKQCRPLDL